MNYRHLGSTGITVSEIGFGSWGIGGLTEGATSYGATNDAESIDALIAAYSEGITFYDTSDIYGNGHSETLIGSVFHGQRSAIIIATKGGFTRHNGPHDLSHSYLREHLEASLQRLRTDHVDLYQLHSPPIKMVTPDVMETLARFRAEGLTHSIGFSAKTPDDALAAIGLGFEVLQVNFNMLDLRAIDNGLFTTARQKGVGIIARTPFNFGFLAKTPESLTFNPTDHRSTWSAEQLERWASAPKIFSTLNEGKERTMAQLALQFCLSFKAVSTVIPGILHAREATENAQASKLEALSDEELRIINQIHSENVFFEAPRKEHV